MFVNLFARLATGPKNKSVPFLQRSGIGKGGSCHALRHATATHMMRHGADIRYVQEILGHQCIESTQIYTHVTVTDLQGVYIRTHPAAQVPGRLR